MFEKHPVRLGPEQLLCHPPAVLQGDVVVVVADDVPVVVAVVVMLVIADPVHGRNL